LQILNWLIAFAGAGLGSYLLSLKDKLQRGVGNAKAGVEGEINVTFISKAKIAGDVTWKKELSKPWQFSGGVTGNVGFKLQGTASGELHVFILKAAAGALAFGESGLSVRFTPCIHNDLPAANMQFGFNGLTVYYMVYYKVGMSNYTHKKSTVPPNLKKELLNNSNVSHKHEHKAHLISEKYWPNNPIIIPLTTGEF